MILMERHIKQRLIHCSEEKGGKGSCELLWNRFLGMEAGCRGRGMVSNLLKLQKLAECSSRRSNMPLIVKQGEGDV